MLVMIVNIASSKWVKVVNGKKLAIRISTMSLHRFCYQVLGLRMQHCATLSTSSASFSSGEGDRGDKTSDFQRNKQRNSKILIKAHSLPLYRLSVRTIQQDMDRGEHSRVIV